MNEERICTDKNGSAFAEATADKEKFTPGPWESKGRTIFPKSQSDPLNTEIVCRIHENRFASREEANEHLIAAAPEMYEALKGLIDIFPSLNIEVDKTVLERTPVWRKLCHILCSADEALKKARGEE